MAFTPDLRVSNPAPSANIYVKIMKKDFAILIRNKYKIVCESCDTSTPWHNTEAAVIEAANTAGFAVAHTAEDGTVNYCENCYKEIKLAYYYD